MLIITSNVIRAFVLYLKFSALQKLTLKPDLYLKTQYVPRSKHTHVYKYQLVNAVYGNNRCLFWDPYKT